MKNDIERKIKHIISKHLGIEEFNIKNSSDLSNDLVLIAWILLSLLWLLKKNSVKKFQIKLQKI